MFESILHRTPRPVEAGILALIVVMCCARTSLADPADATPLATLGTSALVEQLGTNPERCLAIAAELARRGPRAAAALPALRTHLDDDSTATRMLVARAIWRIERDPRPLVAVCEPVLDSGDDGLRIRAAGQLRDVGPPAIAAAPRLRAMLHAENDLLRIHAAEALARINPAATEAATVLARAVDSGTDVGRVQAVYASAAVDHRQRNVVVPALERATTSEIGALRAAATIVLAEMERDLPHESAGWVPTGTRPVATPPSTPESIAVNPSEENPRLEQNVTVTNPTARPVVTKLPVPARVSTVERLETSPIPVSEWLVDEPPNAAPRPLEPVDLVVVDETPLMEPQPLASPSFEERRYRARPLTAIRADITIADEELRAFAEERYDESVAHDYAAEEGVFLYAMGTSRPWVVEVTYWEASGFHHNPLYFENVNSERYGIRNGGDLVQPLIEAGRFYGSVPLMPYMIGAMPFDECVYPLGHYRPGDCVPCQYQGTIRRGYSDPEIRRATIKGAVNQAIATVGLIFIVP